MVTKTDTQSHWEGIYRTKAPTEMSRFSPRLETSLALIEQIGLDRSASIIDIGGGDSTLAHDLIAKGYGSVTVMDISRRAIERAKKLLESVSQQVTWIVADITKADLPKQSYDLWHDRAVFHFLTEPEQRTAYIDKVLHAVRPGGHVIVSTFGPEGPTKCSGLDVVRYDAESLHREFGKRFRLLDSRLELHQTPFATVQQFVYCHLLLV